MARLRTRSLESGSRTDRGQFLLLGAFAVAVLLLVLAGVVNTVAYTETLATHDDAHPTSRDISAIQEDLRRAVEGILERVNEDSDSYDAKVDQFSASVDNWADGTDREHVPDATSVTVRVVETTKGGRITQSANGRPLTNARGETDWTLVGSTEETRRFTLQLYENSLSEGPCSSNECFELVVDGDSTWTVSVSQSAVTVDGPRTGDCEVGSGPVTIDLVNGTVDECDDLPAVIEGVEEGSDSYAFRYRNGGNASGTYGLLVKGSVDDDGDYNDGSPSVTPVIYSTKVAVDYRTPGMSYTNADIRFQGGDA